MSITRFDSFINNHAQKILVKLQEKKSIENLLFDFLNEYNNNILANIFESTTPPSAPGAPRPAAPAGAALDAPRPAAPSSSASRPIPPAPGTPRPPAPGAPRPSAPPSTAPSAAKKIIDDNKEKFKTILKATVTNKVFEMGTELSKHFDDEKKARMAQNYYVVLKNIKEKLIQFLDKNNIFNENTSHNSFKNFLENNSNKFELSKLSSAVLFDPKNTQEYLHEYILKNNIIIKESAMVKYGSEKLFGTKPTQENNLQLFFNRITNSIRQKITEIQNKIKNTDEKAAIEKYFIKIQNKIKQELVNNILPTIYTDVKPVAYKQEEQQQNRYKAIINHSNNLKRLFGLVKYSPKFKTVIGDIDQNQNLYGGLQSLAKKTNGKDTIIDIIEYNNYRVVIPFNLSKAELEAIFLGVLKESKSEFERIYKDRLISPFSKNKSKSGIEMIDDYVSRQKDLKDLLEDLKALHFKYIKNGIAGNDVKENYFNEKDLIYIFNKYANDSRYEDELDDISLYNKPIRTLLEYYKNQNYFDPKNADYKSALEKAAVFDLEISDEDSYELDMMVADTIDVSDLVTEEETAAKEAQKLVKDGKVKLDEPLSEIKKMFAVADDDAQFRHDYLIELALYRMCIDHKKLQELSEEDLKIILVHDFPKKNYTDLIRILTDEEVKSLPDIFYKHGRYVHYVNAVNYLKHNGDYEKMEFILEKK